MVEKQNSMTGFLSDLGGGTHIFTGKGVRRRRILSRIEATPITLHYKANSWLGSFQTSGEVLIFFRGRGVRRRRILSRIEATPIALHYNCKLHANDKETSHLPPPLPHHCTIPEYNPSLKAFKNNMELNSLQCLKFSLFFSYRLLSQWRKLYSRKNVLFAVILQFQKIYPI